jgi:hypothetical protein
MRLYSGHLPTMLIRCGSQSRHCRPNAGSLQNDFVVEGEQHYWVPIAIDRFTGQLLDKQIEVVNSKPLRGGPPYD